MNIGDITTRDVGRYGRWSALFVGLCFVIALCVAIPESRADDEFRIVKIKMGDSVSYLSFKLYRKYNQIIAGSIRSCNPEIRDINLIYVGQRLRFPRLGCIEDGKYISKKEKKVTKKRRVAGSADVEEGRKIVKKGGYITYLTGDVEIRHEPTGDWKPAEINQELSEGDRLRTNTNSTAELITEENSVIRLSEDSVFEISKLEKDTEKKTERSRFTLSLGRLWNKAKRLLSPKSEYTVSTPTAISGVRGTVYSVDVLQNGDTRFKTYSGSIDVWNPSQPSADGRMPPRKVSGPVPVSGPHPVGMKEWASIVLTKHHELMVTKDGPLEKQAFDPVKDRADTWVKWNLERDQDIEKTEPWL